MSHYSEWLDHGADQVLRALKIAARPAHRAVVQRVFAELALAGSGLHRRSTTRAALDARRKALARAADALEGLLVLQAEDDTLGRVLRHSHVLRPDKRPLHDQVQALRASLLEESRLLEGVAPAVAAGRGRPSQWAGVRHAVGRVVARLVDEGGSPFAGHLFAVAGGRVVVAEGAAERLAEALRIAFPHALAPRKAPPADVVREAVESALLARAETGEASALVGAITISVK